MYANLQKKTGLLNNNLTAKQQKISSLLVSSIICGKGRVREHFLTAIYRRTCFTGVSPSLSQRAAARRTTDSNSNFSIAGQASVPSWSILQVAIANTIIYKAHICINHMSTAADNDVCKATVGIHFNIPVLKEAVR